MDIPKTVHWEKYLGYTDRENIEAVNRDYEMGLDAAAINEQISEKKIVFDEMAKTDAVIFDGVAKFIQMLTDNKVRIAICSGALRSDIDLMLAGTDFQDAFEVIVTADDVKHGKPNPEGYLLALSKLNQNAESAIEPSQCIVIEDSHWGLEAAVAAGMRPIAVTNTYSREELEQIGRKVVARLDELTIDDLRELCL